ncbi:ion transporter [Actinoplanes sp. NPDC051861]|uniref:ion transporter n=1 Tax=Actinoplanes sp. NPDC051861 TaxID=3155170 RepID=UPI00341738D4
MGCRFSPGLRTIVTALLRSLPGVGGFLALALVTLYVYGMAGWLIFGESQPDDYGDIGKAVLTLFVLLSLETLPDLLQQGMELSPWTLVYYVSYVLITVNLLLNILIAVIVNSMEEARRLEMTEHLGTDEDHDGVPDEIDRIMISEQFSTWHRA